MKLHCRVSDVEAAPSWALLRLPTALGGPRGGRPPGGVVHPPRFADPPRSAWSRGQPQRRPTQPSPVLASRRGLGEALETSRKRMQMTDSAFAAHSHASRAEHPPTTHAVATSCPMSTCRHARP
jgi:hypothetical protein